jgi:DNA-directed RNA polymerase sigma subunit (sigma70/sigma32)
MADESRQAKFLEDLNNLKEYAKVNGGFITEEDIQEYFQDIRLDTEQLSMVNGFLRAGGIKIRGYNGSNAYTAWEEKKALEDEKNASAADVQEPETDDENMDLYLEELAKMPEVSDEECGYLLMEIEEGKDDEAVGRLTEGCLPKILDFVQPFVGQGVASGDLVQEANLILFDYISEKQWLQNTEWLGKIRRGSKEDLQAVFHGMMDEVRKKIQDQMRVLLTSQNRESDVSRQVVYQVNRVSEAARRFREENGRKATPDELAKAMHVAPEVITQAIEFSGSKIPDLEMKQAMRPHKIGPL